VNTTSNDFAKQGQDFADKTADKVQSGIRDARQTATKVGDKLSSDMEGNRFRCEGRRTYRGAGDAPAFEPTTRREFNFAWDDGYGLCVHPAANI